jgi:hypothetical protein
MVFNLLILFIVIGAIIISAALNRNKLTAPVFRKAFIFELPLYLATAFFTLVIASQLFGPYTHWVLPVFSLAAVPFVRMGYPNFLKFWKEDNYVR